MVKTVCLYVDNSNIFHEGQRYAEEYAHEDRYAFRIHFAHFLYLAKRGRKLDEVVWGGSVPPPSDTVWKRLRDDERIDPVLIPRAESGENETVDNAIQLYMHRHVRKYRSNPGVIVLCTGDGKGYYNDEGFLYDVEGFLEDGWEIEILSWTHSCHGKMKQFAQDNGLFIPLEKFYDSITFIEGARRQLRVNLNKI